MTKSRVSLSHAPMAGRAANRHGSCCSGPPGIDCADFGKSVKDQRHLEDAWWRRTEVPQAPAPFDPFVDPSDCVHGCAGCEEFRSERCNFTCHKEEDGD